jgi:flagellar hook assembly protein FlgD
VSHQKANGENTMNNVNDLPDYQTGKYDLLSSNEVRIMIYDLKGEVVRGVMHHCKPKGGLRFSWDGLDDAGNPMPGGIYLMKVQTLGKAKTCKVAPIEHPG